MDERDNWSPDEYVAAALPQMLRVMPELQGRVYSPTPGTRKKPARHFLRKQWKKEKLDARPRPPVMPVKFNS